MRHFNAKVSTDLMDQNFDESKSLKRVNSPREKLSLFKLSFFSPKAVTSELNNTNVRLLKRISKIKLKAHSFKSIYVRKPL